MLNDRLKAAFQKKCGFCDNKTAGEYEPVNLYSIKIMFGEWLL